MMPGGRGFAVTSGTGVWARIALVLSSVWLAACSSDFLDEITSETDPAPATDASVPASAPAGPTEVVPEGEDLPIDIERVSDGDSLRASSAEGDLEIRLLGINAPEGDECLGEAARDRLGELVADGEVTVVPWPVERDEFGRRLAFVVADDVFVNLRLIEDGLAVARAQADHGFADEFEAAETAAAEAGRGIWSPDACGAPTGAELEITVLNADAPGDDRANPNGEWVEISNMGDAAVDLDGWGLRDESTRHRYDFVPVVVEPGERVRVFTGCGDNDLDDRPIELFWCDPEPPVWNNGGDTAFLLDPNGGTASYLRHKR